MAHGGGGGTLRILLDTNALIWWLSDPGKLTRKADQAIRSRQNTLFVSIVSLWELSMKIRSNKLTILGSSIQYVVDEMRAQRMTTLPVTLAHLYRHEHLDPIHRDPFDRMIVAQALAEGGARRHVRPVLSAVRRGRPPVAAAL